jgi:hypothetical protein
MVLHKGEFSDCYWDHLILLSSELLESLLAVWRNHGER